MSGNRSKESLSLVASTPADNSIRKILKINTDITVDFIRWELHLNDNNFELNIDYGESQPNTDHFKPGHIIVKFVGRYSVSKTNRYHTDLLTLKTEQFAHELLLLKVSNNVFQILES